MRLQELIDLCDTLSPFELQEAWDNSGLIVGDPRATYESVVVSLECDLHVATTAPKNSVIIVHHPLIFSPLKQLDFSSYPANILKTLIEKHCSLIALHTNFDKTHLGVYVAKEVLGWSDYEQDGYLIHTQTNKRVLDLIDDLKSRGLTPKAVVDSGKTIRSITLCTGSGGSLVGSVPSDLIITGDLKYHEAVEAQSLGQSVIDIGHYESERYFGEIMANLLKANGIDAIITNSKNPFLSL